jgi:hypothetical protein
MDAPQTPRRRARKIKTFARLDPELHAGMVAVAAQRFDGNTSEAIRHACAFYLAKTSSNGSDRPSEVEIKQQAA